jgi:hypothetical protein
MSHGQDSEQASASAGRETLHLAIADRACRRAREATADASELVHLGQLDQAVRTIDEAKRHLQTMRDSIAKEITSRYR